MPSAAPAHALLSAAHSLLKPALHHAREPTDTQDKPKNATGALNKLTSQIMSKITPQNSAKTDKQKAEKSVKTVDKPSPTVEKASAKADKSCVKSDTATKKERVTFEEAKDNLEIVETPDSSVLPMDQAFITDDMTDLKDVVDAINKLCDTMKSSDYSQEECLPSIDAELREARSDYTVDLVSSCDDTYIDVNWTEVYESRTQDVSQEGELGFWNERTIAAESLPGEVETWSEPTLPEALQGSGSIIGQAEEVTSDGEPALNWEGAGSELYYTASSEVSLVSDADCAEKATEAEDGGAGCASLQEKEECVAGHVAAMREKFESLTRSTTPCLERSPPASRDVSPSPTRDRVDRS